MRPIRLAVPVVAGALLIAGCGGSDPSDSAQRAPGQGGRPGAMFTGENLTKLADALGVSKSKLQTALQSIMPQGGQPSGAPPAGGPLPGGNGDGPGGGRLAKQLAQKLGLSETKVTKVLQSVMPRRRPAASASPES